MKQIIVMTSTILLGMFIFDLILGNGDGSVINVISDVWSSSIEDRKISP